MDVAVLNLEAIVSYVGPWNTRELWIFDVKDPLASQAHQVMVLARLRVEAGSGSRMVDLSDHAKLYKGIEDAINGCPGDSVNSVSHLIIDLIRCRMVLAIQDHPEDRPPLNGQGESALAADTIELLDALLSLGLSHIPPSWYYVPSGICCQVDRLTEFSDCVEAGTALSVRSRLGDMRRSGPGPSTA